MLNPSASIRRTSSNSSSRQIAIRIGGAHQVRRLFLLPIFAGGAGDDLLGEHIERLLRHLQAIQFPLRMLRSVATHSTSSSRLSGKNVLWASRRAYAPRDPRAAEESRWSASGPSWQTRSTEPMSMPSSSEAVATSALSSPRFSRCSASSRSFAERLP